MTPLAADVNVEALSIFAVVVGATMLVITALAHQSLRSRRPARAQPMSKEPGPDDPDPRSLVGVAETVT